MTIQELLVKLNNKFEQLHKDFSNAEIQQKNLDSRKIKCKRRIWKQIRPERGDFIEHISNGGFYDSGYGWLEKTVTGIGAASPDEDFTYILNNSKVSFENLDMAAIRKIILEWDEAKYHLSTTLMKRIKLINSVA